MVVNDPATKNYDNLYLAGFVLDQNDKNIREYRHIIDAADHKIYSATDSRDLAWGGFGIFSELHDSHQNIAAIESAVFTGAKPVSPVAYETSALVFAMASDIWCESSAFADC